MILCCWPWVTPLRSPRDQFVCTWSLVQPVWVSPVGAPCAAQELELYCACSDRQPGARAAPAGPCDHYLCPQLNCEARGKRRLNISDQGNIQDKNNLTEIK